MRVIISDLHFGARNSLFTGLDADNNPDKSIVTFTNICFARAMQATLRAMPSARQPDLIMNGDVLDLSFASPAVTTSVLRSFFDMFLFYEDTQAQVFDNLYYLPGNHDHELWTAERFSRKPTQDIGTANPKFWNHTTPAFADPGNDQSTNLINDVLSEMNSGLSVTTHNPNMAWSNADGTRTVVVHHGHYVEATYTLMTRFLELLSGQRTGNWTAEDLEQANSSWIDFGWSTLGDLGELGDDMAIFMKLLATGGASHQLQNRVSQVLAQKLREFLPAPQTQTIATGLDYLSHAIVDSLLGKFSTLERFDYTKVLSDSSLDGLHRYLSETVLTQMKAERADQPPEQMTFIFGHTHKPFEDQIVVKGYERPVTVYNTGGWVLDTAVFSTVEGASIVFVDDALQTAAIRLFQMPLNIKTIVAEDGTVLPSQTEFGHVLVGTADPQPDEENTLYQELLGAVRAARKEWEKFSYFVTLELMEKQQMFLKNAEIAQEDAKKSGGLV